MIENWTADLFKEKNLQEVFAASRSLPKSKFNKLVYCLTALLSVSVASFWIFQSNVAQSAEVAKAAADVAFNLSVQILGFLIGGFAIFATVSDPKLMVRLAQSSMGETGLSVFKYIFFSFLSVFYIYIATLSISSMIKILSTSQIVDIYQYISYKNANLTLCLLNCLAFVILVNSIVFSIVRLKSFIWNIYQAFITFLITTDLMKSPDAE